MQSHGGTICNDDISAEHNIDRNILNLGRAVGQEVLKRRHCLSEVRSADAPRRGWV